MSNKLIKKYKFIERDSIDPKQVDRVVKSGTYKNSRPQLSHPDSKSTQKKKIKTPAVVDPHKKNLKTELSLHTARPGRGDSPGLPHIGSANSTRLEATDRHRLTAEQRLKAEFDTRIKAETTQAYQRGFHEGKTNAVAVNEARIEEARKIFDKIKKELDQSSIRFFDEIEKVAMDMSVHLASKIIGEAVNAVPDIIKANVDKCLALLAGAGEVDIKINPSDYDTIKTYLPTLERKSEGRFSFVLDPDRNIEKGGCLVEFEGSVIDGRIETQFQKIKEHMETLT